MTWIHVILKSRDTLGDICQKYVSAWLISKLHWKHFTCKKSIAVEVDTQRLIPAILAKFLDHIQRNLSKNMQKIVYKHNRISKLLKKVYTKIKKKTQQI